MYTSQCRKSKIELSDYAFERDLASRLLLTRFSVFQIDVLKEIIYNSLSFPIEELCETLESPAVEILEALRVLEPTDLFTISDNTVTVNKERRKYFEVQIERFDEDFQPDTSFFQSLLTLVPIQVLPSWYSISKTTDDIFGSIIDKFHRTTKLFERFLSDLLFDEEPLNDLIKEVYNSPTLSVETPVLVKKLEISREKLEEYLIFLEFHKVCSLNYRNSGNGQWKQEVTPFYEWRQYQLFLKQTECEELDTSAEIKSFFDHDFGFIEQLDKMLSSLSECPIPVPSIQQHTTGNYSDNEMQNRIFERICNVNVTKVENGTLRTTENAAIWLGKPIQEKAMALYFSTIHKYRKRTDEEGYNDRDIREVERGLQRIINNGWVPLDKFIKGLTASLGDTHEINLQKKGRFWCYAIPEYDEKQLQFIRHIIFHHLLESGMIAIGLHNDCTYISVTKFGQMALGD